MKFPNALSGVKKLFAAEILQLLGMMAMGAAALMIGFAGISVQTEHPGAALGSGIGAAVLAIGGVVVLVIAAVFEIVGLVKAGRDDSNFKYALYMILVGIAALFVGSFFQTSNPTVYNICSNVNNITDLISTIYVIQGVMSLAGRLGNAEMVVKGGTILKTIIGIYTFAIIAAICYTFFIIIP
nr:hypothetical protein [Ruminococcus sp.]